MNEYEYMDDEIDLGKIFKELWKKAWVLILGAVLGAVIAFAIAWFFVTPTYESTAMVYVNNKSNKSSEYYSTTDLSAAQSLVETYIVIMKQRPTLQTVIDNLQLPYTYEQLKKMVSAEAENNTEIFSITVTSEDPYEACTIVNEIAKVLPEKIAAVVDGASVEIVDTGTVNLNQVAPSYKKYLLIGFLAGLVLAIIFVLAKYFLDKKVHDEDFVNELPEKSVVLASIPDLDTKGSSKKGSGYGYGETDEEKNKRLNAAHIKGEARLLCSNLKFDAAEAYKLLRTNILYALTDQQDCAVIGITSAIRGEAKSTTAINLAYTFAETGKRVLLIEGDMRLPVFASRLNLKAKPGLSNVLGGFCSLNEAIQSFKIRSNWYVITAGDTPPNPAELLESKRMRDLMTALRKNFDHIIIDLPPINVVSDALAAAPYLDGMIMVVREAYSDLNSLTEAIQKLSFAQINQLGFVLTNASSAKKSAYYRRGNNKSRGYGYGD